MSGVGSNPVLVISSGSHIFSLTYFLYGTPEIFSTRYPSSVKAAFEYSTLVIGGCLTFKEVRTNCSNVFGASLLQTGIAPKSPSSPEVWVRMCRNVTGFFGSSPVIVKSRYLLTGSSSLSFPCSIRRKRHIGDMALNVEPMR